MDQRVSKLNDDKKNVIGIELYKKGLWGKPVIIIAIVPGLDNSKKDFSYDNRQGGSSYIALAYHLDVGRKWKQVKMFFEQDRTPAFGWLNQLLGNLEVQTEHKVKFNIKKYYPNLSSYDLAVY